MSPPRRRQLPSAGWMPGAYTMALRDAASNALLASGTVELAP